jgi:hypothetical protein
VLGLRSSAGGAEVVVVSSALTTVRVRRGMDTLARAQLLREALTCGRRSQGKLDESIRFILPYDLFCKRRGPCLLGLVLQHHLGFLLLSLARTESLKLLCVK